MTNRDSHKGYYKLILLYIINQIFNCHLAKCRELKYENDNKMSQLLFNFLFISLICI